LPLDITSLGYSGNVTLPVRCCYLDQYVIQPISATVSVSPRTVPLSISLAPIEPPVTVTGRLGFTPPPESLLQASSRASATLTFTTSGVNPDLRDQAGPFLARIEGTDGAGTTLAFTYVTFSVVPIGTDETEARCPASFYVGPGKPEVLPLEALTRQLFGLKAASPTKTAYFIAVATKQKKHGWEMSITKSSLPLRFDQAEIVLANPIGGFLRSSGGVRSLWTYSTCAAAASNLVVGPGDTQSMVIDKATTSTLVLSEADTDRAVFAEKNFWSLFGGRKVTFEPKW
jgi:hypothetical protein